MPKREDISKILIIGSGPIVSARPVSLIIRGLRPVRP